MQPKTVSVVTFIALLIGFAIVGAYVVEYSPVLAWALTMMLMVALLIAAGYNIKQFWFGALIDRSNKFSLSRLQLICWTVLVLSSFLTAVWINVHTGDVPDPMAVAVPQELWILMGISTTSLVGSPLILGTKKQTAPASAELDKLKDVGEVDHERNAIGVVVENTDPKQASWSDLFKGEEVGNADYLDISRVQMFFFTFILLLGYGYTVANMFMSYSEGTSFGTGGIDSLPILSSGMLALLGISHTAYLGNKAMPHTQTNAVPQKKLPPSKKKTDATAAAKNKAASTKKSPPQKVSIPPKKERAAVKKKTAKKRTTRKS